MNDEWVDERISIARSKAYKSMRYLSRLAEK